MRWRRMTLAVALLAGCSPAPLPSSPATPGPTVVAPASTTPEPVEGSTVPPLQPVAASAGTLYVPGDAEATEQQTWLERLDRASAALARADLGSLTDGWDGRIVVELPSTHEGYLALAGPEGDGAAASTRCDAGDSRITINPVVRAEPSGYLDSLLLHEAVHAATGAGCADTPLWTEEGLAEWLTEQHDPAAQQANQQWLAHELAAGLPAGLPPDTAFRGTAAQVSGAYALAAFAVDTAIQRLGRARAMAYLAAPDEPTTRQLTAWYLDGLRAWLAPPPATASAQR